MTGLWLVIIGGLMQGSFTIPMKFVPGWKWENTWLVFSISGLLLAPWLFAYWTVPNVLEALARSDLTSVLAAVGFGAGWGVGNILFGLGVSRLGAALGFAIILGMTSAIGALAPLVILRPDDLFLPVGRMILVGVLIVLVGIVMSARAGKLKDQALKESSTEVPQNQTFFVGLIICLFSGVTSPMLNFSLTFGEQIADHAERLGAASANANNAIWAPAVSAGALINIAYCLCLLRQNRTGREFARVRGWKPWLLAISMGVLWMGGIAVYGMGAAEMGRLGAALGWPVFMATIIIVANIWGALTGEWKGAGTGAFRWMVLSLAVLSVAIFTLGYSNSLQENQICDLCILFGA